MKTGEALRDNFDPPLDILQRCDVRKTCVLLLWMWSKWWGFIKIEGMLCWGIFLRLERRTGLRIARWRYSLGWGTSIINIPFAARVAASTGLEWSKKILFFLRFRFTRTIRFLGYAKESQIGRAFGGATPFSVFYLEQLKMDSGVVRTNSQRCSAKGLQTDICIPCEVQLSFFLFYTITCQWKNFIFQN